MQNNTNILIQISDDLSFLKKKVIAIEERVEEIDDDLHELKPEYIEKLKKIEEGKFYSYKTVKDLRVAIEKD